VRIGLGIFTFFVPMLAAVSGVNGAFWAPRNQGKSLEQLEREQAACPPIAP
jgi:inositol transporter-like SP family MFS transporter